MPWVEVLTLSEAVLIKGTAGHFATEEAINSVVQWETDVVTPLTTEQVDAGIASYEAPNNDSDESEICCMSEISLDGIVSDTLKSSNQITEELGLRVPDLEVRKLLAKGVKNGIYEIVGHTKASKYRLADPANRIDSGEDSERAAPVAGKDLKRRPKPPKEAKPTVEEQRTEIYESLSGVPVTAETLAERLKLSLKRVKSLLSDLVEAKAVEKISTRVVTYHLPEEVPENADTDPPENPFA